jgi:hypothetical protein
MTRRWWGVFLGGVCVAAAAAGEPAVRFTHTPTCTRAGEQVRIEFAVDRATDVAVTVEDAAGKVVRHLAAGVLGPAAPEPLKPDSLKQALTWDGKDDDGKPVAGGPLRVRVAAGMTPRLDGFLLYDPDATPAIRSLAVGPKGNVYVFYHDATANGNQGGVKIRMIDRSGRRVKVLMPFPADIPYERVKATGVLRDEAGRLVPRLWNWHTLTFYPDPQIARYRSMSQFSLPAVDGNGRLYWIVSGVRLAALDADGGVPYETFISAPLLGDRKAVRAALPSLAVSGDGKHLYLAGLGGPWRREERRRVYDGFPCVVRIDVRTRRAEVFVGKPDRPGTEKDLLTAPRGLAVAGGLLYVADPPAGRIAVFKEADGSFVGQVRIESPQTVSVDPKTGAIYTCVYTGAQTAALVKLDGYEQGREVHRVALPKTGYSPNPGTHRVVGDFTGRRPRFWVPGIQYGRSLRRLGYYEDTGSGFEPHDLSQIKAPWGNGPRDLLVDRRRDELYVKVSGERWHQFDARSGKPVRLVKFSLNQGGPYMACHGANLGVDSAGNYVTHCWGDGRGLMRWRRDLQPLNWDGSDTHRTPWGGMMTFQLNYMAIHNDEIYLIPRPGWRAGKKARSAALSVFGMDLKVKRTLIWQCTTGTIPRVDAKGNIYLATMVKPPDRDFPAFFDGKLPGKVPNQFRRIGEGLYWYCYMYGSIVKFPPDGGIIWYEKQLSPEVEGKPPAELLARPKAKFRYLKAWRPHETGELQGAQWVRFGFCPYSQTYSPGTPTCMCEGAGFDVDPFGRVFFPNLGRFRVEVVDTNNNPICTFGAYGNQDSAGAGSAVSTPPIPLAWPTYVAVSDTHAYVADTVNLRVVKVRLAHAAEATAQVP